MKYQKCILPQGAVRTGATPVFSEKTVPDAILTRHMAPRGKLARLIVLSGKLQFCWEDTQELLDADQTHPILITPERCHHVKLIGPVQFRVEFYDHPELDRFHTDPDAARPGEAYIREPAGAK